MSEIISAAIHTFAVLSFVHGGALVAGSYFSQKDLRGDGIVVQGILWMILGSIMI